jgi:hypothetical protein
MKILARASSLSGYVDAVKPETGTIELAGLRIHMEHGAVVRAGEFVEVEATLGADRVWTGRIKAHYVARDGQAAVTELQHEVGDRPDAAATRAQTPLENPAAGAGDPTLPPPPAADSRASAASSTPQAEAGQASPGTPSVQTPAAGASTHTPTGGQPAAAPPPAVSRGRRYGATGATAGGQRTTGGPTASAGAASPSRPRYTPSSADQKVIY